MCFKRTAFQLVCSSGYLNSCFYYLRNEKGVMLDSFLCVRNITFYDKRIFIIHFNKLYYNIIFISI